MSAPVITTVNPANLATLEEYAVHSEAEIESILERVNRAQPVWAATPLKARAAHLQAIADAIRSEQRALADRVVAEMGKPITEALAEVEKCAWVFEYYADNGPEFLASEEVATEKDRSWFEHTPLGTVLAIMPWNFPWWQVARFAAPALLSGNTALLKHSPNVTGCALDIERVFRAAELPDGVFRSLVIAEDRVPTVVESLLSDSQIAAVSLTGSERAGANVAAVAGREIKPSLLELGGSDAFIVLEDADLDVVVPAAVTSRFLNCGQSCLAAKRFIVADRLYDDFVSRLSESISKLVVDDPRLEATQIGPLARADLVDQLERQVHASIEAGARLVTGGRRGSPAETWYLPTMLSEVELGHSVMTEETFGPVAAVIRADDDSHATAIANHTRYGLGVGVWSADCERGLAVARELTTGAAFVNAVVASDPRLPFGGTRMSGYGRELGAPGARSFVNTRTFVVQQAY